MSVKTMKRIAKITPIMIAFGVSFSGCSVYQPSYGPTVLRNKITVAETVERLELYTGPTGLKLSPRDQDAVSNFLYQYSQSGQGPLHMNVPGNAVNAAGMGQAKQTLRARMQDMGISPNALQAGQYVSRPGAPAPIVVSYRRLTTQPIDCGSPGAVTHTFTNQPYAGFGCAQTANLAAMIDNPRQLLSPYDLDVQRSNRQTMIMNNYVEGKATAAEKPTDQAQSAQEGASSGGG